MRNRVSLFVVALVLVAGCSAVPGLGDTPAPPGVENGELTNTTALSQADYEQRDDEYVVVDTERKITDGNESVERTRISATSRAVLVHTEYVSESRTTVAEQFENQTFSAERIPVGSGHEYQPGVRVGLGDPHGFGKFHGVVNATTFTVDGTTTHDGQRVTVLRASGWRDGIDAEHELWNATMLVDADGLVHELRYTFEDYSGFDVYHRTYELRANADVTVERPEWTDEASATLPTPDVDVHATDDGYVAVTHRGGESFDAFVGAGNRWLDVENFSRGDTVFIGLDGNAVAIGERSALQPIDDQIAVNVYGTASRVHETVNATA